MNFLTRPARHKLDRRSSKLLASIRRSLESHDRLIRINRYLRSHSVRLDGTLCAWRKMRAQDRPSADHLLNIAEQMDLRHGSNEPVSVEVRIKPSGDYRLVCRFGIAHRARQAVLVPLIRATANLKPVQFAQKGVTLAIAQAAEHMSNGFGYCEELDIRNCYPSFENVKEISRHLSLPEEITSHVIMASDLNVVPGQSMTKMVGTAEDDWGDPVQIDRLLAEARRGIPQGSMASPIVAEALISGLIPTATPRALVLCYADNFLVMGKTRAEMMSMSLAMQCALSAHPVGPLLPTQKSSSRPGEIVEFLGHVLQFDGDRVHISVSPKNLKKFHDNVYHHLRLINHAAPSVKAKRVKDATRYVRSWASAFSSCNNSAQLGATWTNRFAEIAN